MLEVLMWPTSPPVLEKSVSLFKLVRTIDPLKGVAPLFILNELIPHFNQ